jgi:hypothetical protein
MVVRDDNRGNISENTNMKAKLFLVSAGVSALCFSFSHAAPEPTSSPVPGVAAQEEIKNIEQERNQALLKHDIATLDRMTSDEYSFINQ